MKLNKDKDSYYAEAFSANGVDIEKGTISGVRIATEGDTKNGDTFDLYSLKTMLELGKENGFVTYLSHPIDGTSASNRDPSKIIGYITGLYLDKEDNGLTSLKGHWQALKSFKANDKQSFDTLLERASDEKLSKTMSMSIVTRSYYVFKVKDKEIVLEGETMVVPKDSDGKIYSRPTRVPSVDFVSLGAATGDLGLRSADEVVPIIEKIENKQDLFNIKDKKFMTKETFDKITATYPAYLQMAVEASIAGKTDEEVLALCEAKAKEDAVVEQENKLKEYAVKVTEFETLVADLKKQLVDKEGKITEYAEKFNKLGTNPLDLGKKPELVDTKNKLEIYYSIKDMDAQTKYFNDNKEEISTILASL